MTPATEPGVTARIARFAWIAARLHGIATADVPRWVEKEIRASVSSRSFQNHVAPIRRASATGKTRGPQGPQRLVRTAPALEDWLAVDEQALGLLLVLYRLANDGMPQPRLLRDLEGIAGLTEIVETSTTREVLAVGVVRNLEEARDLRSRIEEQAPGRAVAMDLVEHRSRRPGPKTWLELARREHRQPF